MWQSYFKTYLDEKFRIFLNSKPWNYKDDLCVIGAYDLYKATGNKEWIRPILENAHFLMREDGTVNNWSPGEHNIDKVSFGKSLRILRDLTHDSRYATAVDTAYHMLDDYPRTSSGNFWHKDIYPNQVWLDGLYMGLPFYAACLVENGDDHWDDIMNQFLSADKLLYVPETHLYCHACDCSKKMDWADKKTGQSPCVWLRAEGWFLMALCDTYEIVKNHTKRACELVTLLQKAIDGILPYESSETHMFLQIVDRTDLEENYVETSGSAMVAYALMKGARLQMLPQDYAMKGKEILDGIHDLYLKKVGDDLQLDGICASAGLGPGPDNRTDRTGTPEYYLSEKQMIDNQHGAAACMMAYSEQMYLQ
jgi:unsaturated rhamnogalacturonyl hydrolase